MRNRNLEERLGKNNWAYTGSVAMKIHANRLGVNFPRNRKIGNVNIAAVYPLNIVPTIVSTRRWKLSNAPTQRRTKFHNNHGATLNLFPANGVLAPRSINIQKFNGFPPVMSLRSLLQKKVNSRNNAVNRNRPKFNRNIAFLKLLLNKSGNNNNSRNRRRSPVRRGNGGGRKLTF
jgi:hypothetical protein